MLIDKGPGKVRHKFCIKLGKPSSINFMNILSDKQIEEFFGTLVKRNYHREEFYDTFLDFLAKSNIEVSEEEESLLEAKAFKIAKKRGFIGFSVIKSIDDMEEFKKQMTKHVLQNKYSIFHFIIENEDENELSLSEIWNKWNNLPPQGWVAGWCNCGEFFPHTFDLGAMNLEENKLNDNIPEELQPLYIRVNDIKRVDFCDDNFMRLYLNNDMIIAVRPYKLDSGIVFSFIKNPLDFL